MERPRKTDQTILIDMSQQIVAMIGQQSSLGMLRDERFRPSIAPRSERARGDSRVLFVQHKDQLDQVKSIRVPLCLLPEGDTAHIKQTKSMADLSLLLKNLPTAAMLLDTFHTEGKQLQKIIWISEEDLFSQTAARAMGIDRNSFQFYELKRMFSEEAMETHRLLINLFGAKGIRVVRLSIGEERFVRALETSMRGLMEGWQYNAGQINRIVDTGPARVASTHGLFPRIVKKMLNEDQVGVQGPVHLETNPPRWSANPDMQTVIKYLQSVARTDSIPHRSLLPCIVAGEPIGEFSALDESSPQLRRDQRWKLKQWVTLHPFPLSTNALFGHAIGMSDSYEIKHHVQSMLEAEKKNDIPTGIRCQSEIAERLDSLLSVISFWK